VKLPIRARLTAWYALFLAAMLVALGAFLVLRLRADLRSTIDRELRTSSGSIKQTYAAEGITGFREITAATLRRSGADAQVLDASGRVIVSYGGDTAADPMVPPGPRAPALAGKRDLFQTNLGDSPQPFRVMASLVTRRHQPQLVVVAESLQGADEAVRKILILLLIAGPVAMAAAALGGWLLVRNALLPVDRMRRKAEQIGIDRLHERLTAPIPRDEIGQLAATLNAMLDRLEAGVIAKRQLIADASHELRTPLAAMRAELDVSLREGQRSVGERSVLESVHEDVDRMSRTVDNLLTLARADEGRLELVRTEVELSEALQTAARPLQALAAAKGISLVLTGESCTTQADPQRLHQALTNLIENAIKFTAPGGKITVSTWHDGNEVGVTVTDTGVGISVEARAFVFDRFYRAEHSRSRHSGGSGLGLAICYEIATAHGGRIWVQSEEGKGSAFSLALPADAPVLSAPAGGR
jgi:two-component system, OmpR family, sensor kinase